MTAGGKREGAGRKKGSEVLKIGLAASKIISEGILPLDFMLQILRDTTVDWDKRLDAAKSAAPYIHPRLATTVLKNAENETFKASLEVVFKSADAKS